MSDSQSSSWIRKKAPVRLKKATKKAVRRYRLWRAAGEIARLPLGQPPSREMLSALMVAWGNPEYAAKLDYLEEVAARAATTAGPILECGSGITTIVMGLMAGRRGVAVWSLEHWPDWHKRVTDVIRHNRIQGVEVCFSPIRKFDGFSWYDAPLAKLPRRFSLIICDGPPGDTLGGRCGINTVMRERLVPGTLILLDDAHRPSEQEVVDRWSSEANPRLRVQGGSAETFAVLEIV